MIDKTAHFGGRPVRVVDIFCGVGGLTHGFFRRRFDVVAGYDLDGSCRFAYETNNGARFMEKDVSLVSGEEVREAFGEDSISVLIGCAPCQVFSRYNQAERNAEHRENYSLLREFARLVDEVRPEIVSMENVPELMKQEVFTEFVTRLKEMDYEVKFKIVHCPDYGVTQNRKRLVLLASQMGVLELIAPTHKPTRYRTVQQAIGHLPPLAAGETDPHDPVHRCSALDPINLQRIAATPPGGSWKDWPEELRLACHKKESGRSYGSVYGRMWWKQPSPTMTTQCIGLGNGRFGHPEQDRAISIREAALLQSFPSYYEFISQDEPYYVRDLTRHIGNAVPPSLGRAIARTVESHLKHHCGQRTLEKVTLSR